MGEVTTQRLKAAGWLSVINAVLSFSVLISDVLDLAVGVTQVILDLTSLVFFIYIFITLRQTLNKIYAFHSADRFITALIVLGVISTVLGLLVGEPLPSRVTTIAIICIIAMIIYAVVLIMFGIQLLYLQDNLFGLLKPFAYTCIAEGVCTATIILAPLALIASAVSDVILAIIFFRISEKLKQAA